MSNPPVCLASSLHPVSPLVRTTYIRDLLLGLVLERHARTNLQTAMGAVTASKPEKRKSGCQLPPDTRPRRAGKRGIPPIRLLSQITILPLPRNKIKEPSYFYLSYPSFLALSGPIFSDLSDVRLVRPFC